jgi:hypothetical protein
MRKLEGKRDDKKEEKEKYNEEEVKVTSDTWSGRNIT